MSAPAWEIPLNKDNWRDFVWETYLMDCDIEFLADILEDGWRNRVYCSPHAVVDHYLDFMKPEEFMAYVKEARE